MTQIMKYDVYLISQQDIDNRSPRDKKAIDSKNIFMSGCFRQLRAFRTGGFLRRQVKNSVRLPSSQSAELVSAHRANSVKNFEFINQTFPEKIAVLRQDGTHAYWATADDARKLIRERKAVGLGNARKFYKLRLSAEAERAEKFAAGVLAETLAKVPVIRAHELLAPSPRRHFGFAKAVSRYKRGSSQHGEYAHSLANQLRVEAAAQ